MMKSPRCSVFQNAMCKEPIGEVNLLDLVTTPHFKDKILEYRALTNLSEKKLKKMNLPAYTPSGTFSARKASSLLTPTNVICIDIDGKDNPSMPNTVEIKRIIRRMPFIWYCGDSVGGDGVFCLIKYENHRLHKLYFKALDNEFKKSGIVIDTHCSDISRLRFISYDSDPILNLDAVVFTSTCNDDEISDNAYQFISESKKQMDIKESILMQNYLINDNRRYGSHRHLIESIMHKIVSNEIDITSDYKDWFTIGCIINMMYGKSGRMLFHKVSQYYPDYIEAETDRLYNSIVAHGYLKRYDCMLTIARKYGVLP